jgi:hypothetical protein
MYDFDESGMLTLDEMILAYRSALSGACKVCKIDPPLEAEIENTVAIGFDSLKKDNDLTGAFSGIDRESFVSFCLTTPDIMAWMEYFDDLKEYSEGQNLIEPVMVWDGIPSPTESTVVDEAYMNPSIGGKDLMRIETGFKPLGMFLNLGFEGFRSLFLLFLSPGLLSLFVLIPASPSFSVPASLLSPRSLGNKPWRNVLPFINGTQTGSKTSKKPAKNLSLEWIYGYNAHSTKQNLFYSVKGDIIYPAANVVVIQNVSANEQRHFNHHFDLVTAITTFNMGNDEKENTIVASGEKGFHPTIHIWEVNRLTILSSLVGFHRGGILRLSFSPSAEHEYLASLGKLFYVLPPTVLC